MRHSAILTEAEPLCHRLSSSDNAFEVLAKLLCTFIKFFRTHPVLFNIRSVGVFHPPMGCASLNQRADTPSSLQTGIKISSMVYIFWGWDNRIIVPWSVLLGERNEDVILQEIKRGVCVDTKGLTSRCNCWSGVGVGYAPSRLLVVMLSCWLSSWALHKVL